MSKSTNTVMQDIRNKPLAYIVQIVGVFVVLFNLWIASKLAPLAQDISTIQIQVKAMQENQVKVEDELEIYIKETARELKLIDSRLDVMHDDILIIKEIMNRLANDK